MGGVVLELKQNSSGALRVPTAPPEMPAEVGIVSPSQGRFAERLCARHGSRHWGARGKEQGCRETNTLSGGIREWRGDWEPEEAKDVTVTPPRSWGAEPQDPSAPDPSSVGPVFAGTAQSCQGNFFRCSAGLPGLQSLCGAA